MGCDFFLGFFFFSCSSILEGLFWNIFDIFSGGRFKGTLIIIILGSFFSFEHT